MEQKHFSLKTITLPLLFLSTLAAVFLFSACGKEETPTSEDISTPYETELTSETTEEITTTVMETETETTAEPETTDPHEGKVVSYLTGEWIDADRAARKPIAVMLSNIQAAIPQSAISYASVIVEAPAEGMVSRLIGVFEDWESLEKIGSVRSARTYYVLMQHEFDPIFLHYGQANYADAYIEDDAMCLNLSGLEAIGSTVYYRTSDRVAPHNAYASASGIIAGISQMGYDWYHEEGYESPLKFVAEGDREALEEGYDAAYVALSSPNNKPWFSYNSEDGLYYRYQYGSEAQIDELTGEQLAVTNIIIRYSDYYNYDATSYMNFYLTGETQGTYISGGKAIDITCVKTDDYSITRYYNAAGEEITLNTGKTWIMILPTTAKENTVISGQ